MQIDPFNTPMVTIGGVANMQVRRVLHDAVDRRSSYLHNHQADVARRFTNNEF